MDNTALYCAGVEFVRRGRRGRIHAFDRKVAVLEYDGGKMETCDPQEFHLDCTRGEVRLIPPQSRGARDDLQLTDQQLAEIKFWEQYLVVLDAETYPGSRDVMQQVIDRVSNQKGIPDAARPHVSKLYRRYTRWVASGRSPLALTRSQYKQERGPRVPGDVLDMIDDVLDEFYLRRRGEKLIECYRIFQRHYKKGGFDKKTPPSRSFFYKYANELDPIEVTLIREGRTAAIRKARRVAGSFVAEFLLERCELDAVHIKVALLSDEDGTYIGTATVFLLIDCYSRAILGYSYTVSKKPAETTADAIECIKHAIMPKVREDHIYTTNTWDMNGFPCVIGMDAGPGHASRPMTSFLAHMRIERHIPETRQPWRRPFIERFNRTLRSQLMDKVDGYTGSRKEEKYLDESMAQMARHTVSEFEQLLTTYIVDVYHQSPHDGLDGKTPAQVWQERVEKDDPRFLETDRERSILEAFGGMEYEGKQVHQNTGIELHSVRYNSQALQDLWHRLSKNNPKPRVTVLFNPQDISQITVLDPEYAEYIVVGNTHHIPPGTTLYEHRARRKANRQDNEYPEGITHEHPVMRSAEARQRQRQRDKQVRHHPEASPAEPQSREKLEAQMGGAKKVEPKPSDQAEKPKNSKRKKSKPRPDRPRSTDHNFRRE